MNVTLTCIVTKASCSSLLFGEAPKNDETYRGKEKRKKRKQTPRKYKESSIVGVCVCVCM